MNNLNIFTFIKDIYQSLKHIDKSLTISNDALNKKINKLEDNQQILIDKLTNIESVLNRLGEMNKSDNGLDKNIEFELLEKMKILNKNEINNSKLSLKPEELTIANLLENSYSFTDINKSISGNEFHTLNNENSENIEDNIVHINYSNRETLETLDTLLF